MLITQVLIKSKHDKYFKEKNIMHNQSIFNLKNSEIIHMIIFFYQAHLIFLLLIRIINFLNY